MKKNILLIILITALYGCSINEENSVNYSNDYFQKPSRHMEIMSPSLEECFINIQGYVYADVSNGIGYPIINFKPKVFTSLKTAKIYRIKLEIQQLSDPDDINSDTGKLLSFRSKIIDEKVILTSPPAISVVPVNIPIFYKWRIAIEGLSQSRRETTCFSKSIWYMSPIL